MSLCALGGDVVAACHLKLVPDRLSVYVVDPVGQVPHPCRLPVAEMEGVA